MKLSSSLPLFLAAASLSFQEADAARYKRPKWLTTYRESYFKNIKKCKFLTDPDRKLYTENPGTGSECPKKFKKRGNAKNYLCGLGEQTCDDGTSHPEQLCECDVTTGLLDCMTPSCPIEIEELKPDLVSKRGRPGAGFDGRPEPPAQILPLPLPLPAEPEPEPEPIEIQPVEPVPPVQILPLPAEPEPIEIQPVEPVPPVGGMDQMPEPEPIEIQPVEPVPPVGGMDEMPEPVPVEVLEPDEPLLIWEPVEIVEPFIPPPPRPPYVDPQEGCPDPMPSLGDACDSLDLPTCSYRSGGSCRTSFTATCEEKLGGTGELQWSLLDQGTVCDGRPFVDVEGSAKFSDTLQSDSQAKLWSAKSTAAVTDDKASNYSELAEDWKGRAVGEHASIASFAAFTISLMSHQAPPDLVEGSLVAAMDELRHAKTSFEMASMLTNSVVEPAALPASKHSFGTDFNLMATGVAEEGCIMETISALRLAQYVDGTADETDAMIRLSAEKTAVIAQEEGTHSALAWRTIHWVCSTDENACQALLENSFNESKLYSSLGTNVDDDMKQAWKFIHSQLVPLVTTSSAAVTTTTTLEGDSEVFRLARSIVESVQSSILGETVFETPASFLSSTTINASSAVEQGEECDSQSGAAAFASMAASM